MARDGGRARGLSSRAARGGAADGDHLYCNSARARARVAGASHFLYPRAAGFLLFVYSIYRLSPAPPILTGSLLSAFTFLPFSTSLFAFHARLRQCTRRRQASRFMRSLSIFHDSLFYCLRESLYPAFPPRGARETLTRALLCFALCLCVLHVSFITPGLFLSFSSDFLFSIAVSFLFPFFV